MKLHKEILLSGALMSAFVIAPVAFAETNISAGANLGATSTTSTGGTTANTSTKTKAEIRASIDAQKAENKAKMEALRLESKTKMEEAKAERKAKEEEKKSEDEAKDFATAKARATSEIAKIQADLTIATAKLADAKVAVDASTDLAALKKAQSLEREAKSAIRKAFTEMRGKMKNSSKADVMSNVSATTGTKAQ